MWNCIPPAEFASCMSPNSALMIRGVWFKSCIKWNSHSTIPLWITWTLLQRQHRQVALGFQVFYFQYLLSCESRLHQRTWLQSYIRPLLLQREYSLFFWGWRKGGREGEYPLPIRWWSIKRRCTPLTFIPWSIYLPPPWIFSVKEMLFFRFRRLAANKQKEVSCCGCWVFTLRAAKQRLKKNYSRVTNKQTNLKLAFVCCNWFAAETPAVTASLQDELEVRNFNDTNESVWDSFLILHSREMNSATVQNKNSLCTAFSPPAIFLALLWQRVH